MPHEYVQENARLKASDVFARVQKPFRTKHGRAPSCVVGADTVVVLDDEILEKPKSPDEARRMLTALSAAGSHKVLTGVALLYGDADSDEPHVNTFFEETTVTFASLSPPEIEAYVASGEPMDKAGGYGIQGMGGAFVTRIDGDYQNVVGFPLARFSKELETERLQAWIDASPQEEPAAAPAASDDADTIIDASCEDIDECGLPSD